jgi:hypothetical protein
LICSELILIDVVYYDLLEVDVTAITDHFAHTRTYLEHQDTVFSRYGSVIIVPQLLLQYEENLIQGVGDDVEAYQEILLTAIRRDLQHYVHYT